VIKKDRKLYRAQSLLELLLSVAVGTIMIGGSVLLMGVSLKNYQSIRQNLQANSLLRQYAEVIISLAKDDWHNIADLTKDSNYHLSLSGNSWSIQSGVASSTVNSVPYNLYFQVSSVNRDASGDISDSGDNDPNTLKIVNTIEYGPNYVSSSSLSFYLTRSGNNKVFQQTDWSGGSGQTGPIPNPGNKFDSSDNIDYSTSGQITMATTTSDSYLISSILDTGVSGGAGFNSLLWQGSLGSGGSVKFQIAFSNSPSGPWTYYGPTSTSDYYQPNPDVSVSFPTTGSASPQNYRYIRYKVYLSTTDTTPQVDDIIINWSP